MQASCSLVGIRQQDAHTTNLQKRDAPVESALSQLLAGLQIFYPSESVPNFELLFESPPLLDHRL